MQTTIEKPLTAVTLSDVQMPSPSDASSAVETSATDAARRLLAIDPTQSEQVEAAKVSIEAIGAGVAKQIGTQSRKLDAPIKELMARGEDGGPVAKSLIDLKMQVEDLDPARVEFSSSGVLSILGKLPFFGTPAKRYFTRFQSAGTVIQDILKSLESGRDQLKRDNVMLADDQARLRQATKQLAEAIALATALDRKLSDALANEIASDDPRHQFLSEEILFPLRQVIQDRQQALLVAQQGVMTMEVVIRNNKELIRGVSRCTDVTVTALRVAVTLALALAQQRIVLDKIEAVNTTTENLLAGNAARLKQQGAEINKRAASSQLDVEVLRKAFEDIRSAMDDLSKFRQDALPRMAQDILKMDAMAREQEGEILKAERAIAAKAALKSDFPIEVVA